MGNSRFKDVARDMSRLAFKLGVLLTEPKVREALGNQVKSRVSDLTDSLSSKYEDATDRMEAARMALRGNKRPSTALTVGYFVAGLGVGAGLGLLLAPARGSETRGAIASRATDARNKVVDSFTTATGRVRSVGAMPKAVNEG